jgi:hypothetical protein
MDYRSMALGNSGFNDKKNWDPNNKQNPVRGFNLGQDQLKVAKELAKSKGLMLQMPVFQKCQELYRMLKESDNYLLLD